MLLTVVLEKILESPLGSKDIQPANSKGNQSWIFIGRTDTEAEAPILCPLMGRTGLFEKTLMLGNIEGRRRKQERRSWLDGITHLMDISLSKLRELLIEGGLVCCIPRGCKESITTERVNCLTDILKHHCSYFQCIRHAQNSSTTFCWPDCYHCHVFGVICWWQFGNIYYNITAVLFY